MSDYPEPSSYIKDKTKVELDLSSYATKQKLKDAAGADTSNLAAKKDVIALKAEVDKRDINKLDIVPTGLKNVKIKVGDLDVDKLKTVPVDLKELSDAVCEEVVNNKKTQQTKYESK